MFSLLLKIKRRIKLLLRVQSESRQISVSTPRSRFIKVLYLILASVLIGILYPGEDLYDPLDMPRQGEISLEAIIAPFPITLFKSERELRDEREDVQSSIPLVIDCDSSVFAGVISELDQFISLVDSVRGIPDTVDARGRSRRVLIVSDQFPQLSRDAVVRSIELDDLSRLKEILEPIYVNEIYEVGVMPDAVVLPESRNKSVLLRKKDRDAILGRDRILYVATANGLLLTSLNRLTTTVPIDVEYLYQVGRSFIIPNLIVNSDEYNRRLEDELSEISNTKEIVNQGDIIIRSGRKVSSRQEMILKEMARIQRGQAAERGWLIPLLPVFARILLVLASFALLYLFLRFFRREIFASNVKLFAILMVFGLQLFLINLVNGWGLSVYLFPIAFLPIMITILFDSEVGVMVTIVLALLLGMMHRFDFTITLMTVFVGMVAIFVSREVRKRTHFFRIMFATSLAYAIIIALVENLKLTPGGEVLTNIEYGLINGVISLFIVIGALPVFESLFSITTDITLLELSDMNQPLLRRLALEAPGTYHHSMVVGNLSEKAADEIGANSLLARVGAYYHDIGKIAIPEYFVENQLGIKSKHEMLTPSMSSIILTSHVKKGRILGEMNDIPDDVLNFIEEHHGTMVMTYFYNKALEEGADDVSIDKFRYPGPRPQIRETGIAMLADAVEAASRTLEDPTPARINGLIQRIIDDRFKSGELDECPLTLRDLARIKESFVQILIGIFHHRIDYPKKDEVEE